MGGAVGGGSIVTHWPHCQVNATWVFYRRHCSRWHFECTSHTLSLSITHSLHFLGQPPKDDIISRGCVGRKFPARWSCCCRGGGSQRRRRGKRHRGFQRVDPGRVSFLYRRVAFWLFSWPDRAGEFASAIAVEGSTSGTLKNRLH